MVLERALLKFLRGGFFRSVPASTYCFAVGTSGRHTRRIAKARGICLALPSLFVALFIVGLSIIIAISILILAIVLVVLIALAGFSMLTCAV